MALLFEIFNMFLYSILIQATVSFDITAVQQFIFLYFYLSFSLLFWFLFEFFYYIIFIKLLPSSGYSHLGSVAVEFSYYVFLFLLPYFILSTFWATVGSSYCSRDMYIFFMFSFYLVFFLFFYSLRQYCSHGNKAYSTACNCSLPLATVSSSYCSRGMDFSFSFHLFLILFSFYFILFYLLFFMSVL